MMKWIYKKKFTQILKYNFDYKIIRKMFTPEVIFYVSQKAPGNSHKSVLSLYKKRHLKCLLCSILFKIISIQL